MESKNTVDFASAVDESFLSNFDIDNFVEAFSKRPANCNKDISVFDFVKPTKSPKKEINIKKSNKEKEANKEEIIEENMPKKQRNASLIAYDLLIDLEEKRQRIMSDMSKEVKKQPKKIQAKMQTKKKKISGPIMKKLKRLANRK